MRVMICRILPNANRVPAPLEGMAAPMDSSDDQHWNPDGQVPPVDPDATVIGRLPFLPPAPVAPAASYPPPAAPQPGYGQPPTAPQSYGQQPNYGQQPAYGQQPTYWQPAFGQQPAYPPPGYGAPGYPPPGYPAPPTKSRSRLIAIIVAAVVVLVVALSVIGYATNSGSSQSQASVCADIQKGVNLSGSSLTVTAGGREPSDMPTFPSGRKASCTLAGTQDGSALRGFIAAYGSGVDLNAYKSMLEANGYTPGANDDKADGVTAVEVNQSAGHGVALLQVNGFKAIEEIEI